MRNTWSITLLSLDSSKERRPTVRKINKQTGTQSTLVIISTMLIIKIRAKGLNG